MKGLIGLAARIVVGAIFMVFGVNGISTLFFAYSFIEFPPPEEGSFLAQYFDVLSRSYILKTVKIIEVLGAFMLLSGIFLPLGAVLLAPIVVNIFLFHLTLEQSGMPMAVLLLLGESVIFWAYWPYFRTIFHTKTITLDR